MNQLTEEKNNYAFIDAQNVYLGILEFGWKIDWKKFRIWLHDKFNTSKRKFILFLNREKSKIEYNPRNKKGA